jgi:hypothetical protein
MPPNDIDGFSVEKHHGVMLAETTGRALGVFNRNSHVPPECG